MFAFALSPTLSVARTSVSRLFTCGHFDNVCARFTLDVAAPLEFAFAPLLDLHSFRCVASPAAHLLTSVGTCERNSKGSILNSVICDSTAEDCC